ncbi:hypothetical protein Ddye_011141 [Dipteronia dyeriana]|uniref:Uncharacterized protein n=1 Tax=Dipteronia dyeriana TaxID=168575 RepID=A0AAE0CNZ6_9ROSI|nr:hypothetical protein Ddye_011141 [Dipteronia dyeriana]
MRMKFCLEEEDDDREGVVRNVEEDKRSTFSCLPNEVVNWNSCFFFLTTELMRSRLKDFLKTPEGDWFKGKLTRHDHFEALVGIDDALNRVPEDFVVEDRSRFMASYFGHFMLMHQEMKFSGGVIHRPLLEEVDQNGPTDEMRFLLGNHVMRFLKVEICLIPGLRFGVVPDTSLYAAVENDIHHWYFPGADKVSLEELRVVLTLGEFQKA